MGKVDVATKVFLGDASVFADAINFAIFRGRQVVQPSQLQRLDTEELVPVRGPKKEAILRRSRDLVRECTIMSDEQATYAIIGEESQANVHHAMPLKAMTYDAGEYVRQVQDIADLHKKRGDSYDLLSGLSKEDRLKPVLTFVIYFGAEPWDGPRRLSDMLAPVPAELQRMVQDYEICIIDPSRLPDKEFSLFQTDLGAVLQFIKHSGNRAALEQMMKNDGRFEHMSVKAANVLQVVANIQINIRENEQEVDMCKAWADQWEDGKAAGIAEGKAVGGSDMLWDLVDKGWVSDEHAAQQLNVTPDQFLEMKAARVRS